MPVRPFEAKDAEFLGRIFFGAVRQGALSQYSSAQVEAWAPSVPSAAFYRGRAVDGRLIVVAVEAEDVPLAYGDLERSGHMDHLFCRPDKIGSGLASQIYNRLEDTARMWKLQRLFVEASELARPLFLHKGFSILRRHEFLKRKVMMHNYDMEKLL